LETETPFESLKSYPQENPVCTGSGHCDRVVYYCRPIELYYSAIGRLCHINEKFYAAYYSNLFSHFPSYPDSGVGCLHVGNWAKGGLDTQGSHRTGGGLVDGATWI